jgi:hypothetical protein
VRYWAGKNGKENKTVGRKNRKQKNRKTEKQKNRKTEKQKQSFPNTKYFLPVSN